MHVSLSRQTYDVNHQHPDFPVKSSLPSDLACCFDLHFQLADSMRHFGMEVFPDLSSKEIPQPRYTFPVAKQSDY